MRIAVRRKAARSGFALTVLKSPRISRFGVKLTNRFPDGGVAGTDLVLGRAFGALIDRVGGVPFGASGSPVFLGKRLIGAISQVISSDAKLVGITPIADMLALVREPLLESTPGTIDGELRVAHPVAMVASGFRMEKAKAELNRHFQCSVGVAQAQVRLREAQPLRAGGPIGVALMTGDLKLGFIGTVTLIENNLVFAFGHPLLFAGPTNLPMTNAEILETATGSFPAKIGVLGQTVGTVVQDRAAGTLGVINQVPQGLVPMQFSVNDLDRGCVETITVEAVHIPTELPFLAFSAALETILRAMNRAGAGTAQWEWTIRLADTLPITMKQEQYDPFNIAFAIALSVFPLLEDPLAAGLKVIGVELSAVVTMANTLN